MALKKCPKCGTEFDDYSKWGHTKAKEFLNFVRLERRFTICKVCKHSTIFAFSHIKGFKQKCYK